MGFVTLGKVFMGWVWSLEGFCEGFVVGMVCPPVCFHCLRIRLSELGLKCLLVGFVVG